MSVQIVVAPSGIGPANVKAGISAWISSVNTATRAIIARRSALARLIGNLTSDGPKRIAGFRNRVRCCIVA